MFSLAVKAVMEKRKLLTVPSNTSVSSAARLMAQRKVGAIMIVEGKQLTGIFTERDALFRVLAQGRDPEITTLEEVMTPDPQTVDPDRSFGYAMVVMYENGFRHLPVVEDGNLIGIVSIRNALDPELEEFVSESQRREQFLRELELSRTSSYK